VLTKTVLCAEDVGACRLVEVPFTWEHGDPLPQGAAEQWFPTPAAALSAMAARGRNATRVHVEGPPRKPAADSDKAGSKPSTMPTPPRLQRQPSAG
jgi:hypothetical protein